MPCLAIIVGCLIVSILTIHEKQLCSQGIGSDKNLPKIQTHEIKSVPQFIKQISAIGSKSKSIFFRGHKDRHYKIQPSVFRPDLKVEKYESDILRELMTFHPEEFVGHRSTFENLAHAQHHGLPTRLLDVTFSSVAGLYFAVEPDEDGQDSKDGRVIRLEVHESRIKNFDSDALSCISNLSKLSHSEREEIEEYIKEYKSKGKNVASIPVSEFNKLPSVKRLLQFVKQEKPYFENRVKAFDIYSNYLALPMRSSKRVSAQSGAFLVSGMLKTLGVSSKISREYFDIPKSAKPAIRQDLNNMGVNRMTMFPDLQSSAKYILDSRRYA